MGLFRRGVNQRAVIGLCVWVLTIVVLELAPLLVAHFKQVAGALVIGGLVLLAWAVGRPVKTRADPPTEDARETYDEGSTHE